MAANSPKSVLPFIPNAIEPTSAFQNAQKPTSKSSQKPKQKASQKTSTPSTKPKTAKNLLKFFPKGIQEVA
jgi:hypothetical protein